MDIDSKEVNIEFISIDLIRFRTIIWLFEYANE